jgi:hypothetical protein
VSHVGTLFTGLLNKRLLKWAEQHNILTDAQFGFRPGFGTTELKSFPKIGIKYALPVIKYSFIRLSNPVDLSRFKSRIPRSNSGSVKGRQLFTGLLNKRLLKWAEQHNSLTDAQFGFRQGFGSTDAIFALHSLITSTLRKGKRLYCCFVDYTRAFDSVIQVILI